jgi:hypothetical protein
MSNRFPLDVDRHYIQAVWSIAGKTDAPKDIDNWKPASFSSIIQTARFTLSHPEKNELNMKMSFCRMIRDRASEKWTEGIINRVISIALDVDDTSNDDYDTDDLRARSLNSVRGSAANALSSLLWADYDRYDLLRQAISCLINDENPAVRIAILEAVIAAHNVDKVQSTDWLFQLINGDERIARYDRSLEMLFNLWSTYKDDCLEVINRLFYSEDDRSREMGAFIATNIYIVVGEDVERLHEMIFSGDLSECQIKGCSTVSVELMGKLEFREKAKSIIDELMNYSVCLKDTFRSLFYNSSFILSQDIDLIKTIVAADPNDSFLALRHFISENDVSIIELADVILHLCQQFLTKRNIDDMRKGGYYSIYRELPTLVAELYDQSDKDFSLRSKCLDMWDALYKSDIGNARMITQKIMDY